MSTVTDLASRRAEPPTGALRSPDTIHLHAQAENALSVALFYLRQPAPNARGAARKAVQALDALGQLCRVEASPEAANDTGRG